MQETQKNSKKPDFLAREPGFWSDLLSYAKRSKKWWLVPLIVLLVFLGFALIAASGALPFIYTLF